MLEIEKAVEIQIQPFPNFVFEFKNYIITFSWKEGKVYASFKKDDKDVLDGRLMAYNEEIKIDNDVFMLFNPYMTPTFGWEGLGTEIKLLYAQEEPKKEEIVNEKTEKKTEEKTEEKKENK